MEKLFRERQPYKIVNTVEEAVPADMYKILAISYDDCEGEDRFKEEVVDQLKETVHGFYSNNAFPGVREYGNYVTVNDNNHDGVGEIIHKFILKDC